MNNENELTAALAAIEKCREITGCPEGVDLQDWVKQLAAENVALNAAFHPSDIPSEWTDVFGDTAVIEHDAAGDNQGHSVCWSWVGNQEEVIKSVLRAVDSGVKTPATDRIVAGIKAEAKSHDLNAFISHYSAELDEHIANGGGQFDERSVRLRGVIVGARMFREKLREEEKALVLREGAK